MHTIRDGAVMAHVLSASPTPGLERLLALRSRQLGTAIGTEAELVIVEPGDSIDQIALALGASPLIDLDGNPFGDPDFSPWADWVEHHADAQAYELAFALSDSFTVALIVPDVPGIDPNLLAFCREYASEAVPYDHAAAHHLNNT